MDNQAVQLNNQAIQNALEIKMKNSTDQVSASGAGVIGGLGVWFVYLKLIGTIGWSWWYVTLPFWGPPIATLGIFGIVLSCRAIAQHIAYTKKDKKRLDFLADRVENLKEQVADCDPYLEAAKIEVEEICSR